MSRYIATRPLEPEKKIDILELNAAGHLIGAWFGYWNYKRGIVALYPNVTNHSVNWPDGKKPDKKKYISDRYIEVKKRDETKREFKTEPLTIKATPEKTEYTSIVQERIKF